MAGDTVEAHVRSFGLTVPRVVVRVFNVPFPAARAELEALRVAKRVHRYFVDGAPYYSTVPRPFSPADLRERFAVLWFACMGEHPRPLVPHERIEALLAEPAALLGVKKLLSTPVYGRPPLSLIRLCPLPPPGKEVDLARAMAGLERFVNSAPFLPWLWAARDEQFVLTYLISDAAQRREFTAWLTAHPLVGRFPADVAPRVGLPPGVGVVAPVVVAPLVEFPGPR